MAWQKGWPLTLSNGAVVLHLGTVNESLVRLHDFYLCIRSSASDVSAHLYACWRTTINETTTIVKYHQLDPEADPIAPLYIEMLAGEDLPHLLQTLLVGVEHAICRIPLDELTFPPTTVSNSCNNHHNSNETNQIVDSKNANKRMECNLKRRELITKNNSINKKYAIKRISCCGSILYDKVGNRALNESEILDSENVDETSVDSTNECNDQWNDVSISTISNDLTNETDSTSGTTASTLPLFCLGGSFPHIDSDEESGDDAKKIQSGEYIKKKKIHFLTIICNYLSSLC